MRIMKILKVFLVLAVSLTTLSSFTTSSEIRHSSWEFLGKKTVGAHGDHDELFVTGSEGLFTKLKFKVDSAPIYVRNIRVVYRSGADENHAINRRFNAGDESRSLDLNGHQRIIRKIVFNYDTLNVGAGRAKLSAFGRH